MKRHLLGTLLLILLHGTLFSQEEETSHVKIDVKLSKTVTILNREHTSNGSIHHKIPITIELMPDATAEEDYLFEISLKHFSSNDSVITIMRDLIRITADDLNERQSVEREIDLNVLNDTLDVTYMALIKVKCDQIEFDEDNHQCLIQITKNEVPKSEKEKQFDVLMSNIQASDTIEMACLKLITTDGSVPIEYEQRKSGIYEALQILSIFITKLNNPQPIDSSKSNLLEPVKPKIDSNQIKKPTTFQIAKAYIYVEEGRFWKITLIPKDLEGRFESRYPISATNYNIKRRLNKLDYIGPNTDLDSAYVSVGQVLDYLDFTSKSRFPPTQTITLTPNDPIDTLRFIRNTISFFDARVYTDPIGFSGNANGLVQTDLRAKFILNTSNIGRYTWASNLHVSFNLSKFDTKFDTLTLPSLQARTDETILSLRRQANLNLNIDFEIFRYSGVHESVVGLGHQIALTNIQDTASLFRRNLTPSFFLYWHGTVFATPWIRMNLTLPLYANYNYDQSFTGYEKKWNLLIVPEAEIRLDPARTEGQKSPQGTTLFARFRYFDMPWAKGDNFMQFQTGVSIPITELIK